MAHGNLKVLDSDIHIIEPPDLWQRYIDPAFRDRAPQGLTEDAGDLRLAWDGKPWGRVAADADRSRRRHGHDHAKNQERWRPFQERGWTSKVQVEAMDIEGIDVAVIYPSRASSPWPFPTWSRDSPPPWRARTTTGSTSSARRTPSACSARG